MSVRLTSSGVCGLGLESQEFLYILSTCLAGSEGTLRSNILDCQGQLHASFVDSHLWYSLSDVLVLQWRHNLCSEFAWIKFQINIDGDQFANWRQPKVVSNRDRCTATEPFRKSYWMDFQSWLQVIIEESKSQRYCIQFWRFLYLRC